MSEEQKTAIILMGGGMRSTHGAGFLYALGTKLGLQSPDIAIGTSGNAANVLYFIAGQYDFLKQAWTEKLSTPKFISFWRFWRVMNIDYLVDTVFKKQLPLDISKISESSINYYIPVTDIESGQSKYMSKKDEVDIFELLRAAKATPMLYEKQVSLLGHRYTDGELGPGMLDHVNFALSLGATKIIVVDDSTGYSRLGSFLMHVYALSKSTGLREAIVKEISAHAVCVAAANATVICVTPTKLSLKTASRNKQKLVEGFESGIEDALALEPELRTLFNTPA